MKQILLSLFYAVALAVSTPVAAKSSEPLPEDLIRIGVETQAWELFSSGRFEELDRIYDDYALSSARTPSSVWKSTLVYFSLMQGMYDVASPKNYEAFDALIGRWLRERPTSALARVMRAVLLKNHAWAIRGHDAASKVKQENWAPFHERLRAAREYLEKEKTIAAKRPEYYLTMIELLQLQQQSPQQVFDEGVSKFPDYYQMYFGMLEYLLPRWSGSVEQIEQFASESAARTQNIEGRTMYTRIYWYASQVQFGESLMTDSKVSWERMRGGFDDLIKRYPVQWNLQHYASFACDAQDRKTLAKLFKRIRQPVVGQAWRSQERFDACKQLSRMRKD